MSRVVTLVVMMWKYAPNYAESWKGRWRSIITRFFPLLSRFLSRFFKFFEIVKKIFYNFRPKFIEKFRKKLTNVFQYFLQNCTSEDWKNFSVFQNFNIFKKKVKISKKKSNFSIFDKFHFFFFKIFDFFKFWVFSKFSFFLKNFMFWKILFFFRNFWLFLYFSFLASKILSFHWFWSWCWFSTWFLLFQKYVINTFWSMWHIL